MIGYLLVAAGAAVGAPLRYLTDRIVQSRRDTVFPWGTFTVNAVGSLILGGVTAATLSGTPNAVQILIGTGFCGALTTYSTFSYETIRLLQERARRSAGLNTFGSMLIGLGSAAVGFTITSTIFP